MWPLALGTARDRAFARDYFERFVRGRDLVDYAKLLARAGLVLRKRQAGRPWLGEARLQVGAGGAQVVSLVPFDSPLYTAGIAQDDRLVSLGGVDIVQPAQIDEILGRHKPGDRLPVRFIRRGGTRVDGTVTLAEDPRVEIVTLESTGAQPTAEQRQFRQAWLGGR